MDIFHFVFQQNNNYCPVFHSQPEEDRPGPSGVTPQPPPYASPAEESPLDSRFVFWLFVYFGVKLYFTLCEILAKLHYILLLPLIDVTVVTL